MNLTLWAELNMVGNVSYSDYCAMTPEEAQACYAALQSVINASKSKRDREGELNAIAAQYRANAR